jgi:flagellin
LIGDVYNLEDNENWLTQKGFEMTTINAGSSFHRIQNALDTSQRNVSDSMLRLATGRQSVAAGDNTANQLIGQAARIEVATLKTTIGVASEALNAVEMATNDVASLSSIVERLSQLNTLGANEFNTAADTAAILSEATALFADFENIQDRSAYKGNVIIGGTADSNEIYFSSGAETDDNEFHVDITVTGGTVSSLASTVTATNISIGAADDATTTGMANLRSDVDTMQLSLGNMYNKIQNISDQFTNHKASYEQDLSAKMDVDFAGETTLLAKNQILAQAGTAMLAQANAQGQGMLALLQS